MKTSQYRTPIREYPAQSNRRYPFVPLTMSVTHGQSPFEAMPLELHFNVLSRMSGPEDVLSTIHASPAALRALQTGREQVFAAVIKNCLAPEVLREFLAIWNAPDHNSCPSAGSHQTCKEWADDRESILQDWTAWEQKAGGFLRSHALGAFYLPLSQKENPTEFKAQIKFMIRLYFCVSRLISYYLPYTRSRPTGTRIDLPPAKDDADERPPLTETELLRLQRGFLRYELCCRLIGIPSISAFCNTRVFDDVVAPHPTESRDLWEDDPFTRLLPLDEIEEVICTSEFVNGLYNRLRCTFVDDLQKAVLDFSHDEDAHGNTASNPQATKTVRDWLSDHPLKGGYYPFKWSGEFGSRLGLAFLDRMIRSTTTDRRDFMRAAFHTFRRLSDGTLRPNFYQDTFLRPEWNRVVYERGYNTDQDTFSPLEVGPQCNSILKTCSTDWPTIRFLTKKGPYALRMQGWAFFDGQSDLRSLDLPQDNSPSTIRDWVLNESRNPHAMCCAHICDSALSALFTEDEWSRLFEKYAPKDLGDDFEAMSRFVADVRAVVDFRSERIPQMD